ncbi:uncharacterized protein LOC126898134 [Daktulosphaira vitifoliae]|uniref:uncharacterized protein LOC126898134 n=1 Tax=Daktulosphaira vitifoliae TaxID=58002 RepID=UPI0021A987B0|nr:uncharacterized protein LOC126898134 [Daktulosphaira vitifoliae]
MSYAFLKNIFKKNKKQNKSKYNNDKNQLGNSRKEYSVQSPIYHAFCLQIRNLELYLNKKRNFDLKPNCLEFIKTLNNFESYLNDNPQLDYIKQTFSKEQQKLYWNMTQELSQCFSEFISVIKHNIYISHRNESILNIAHENLPIYQNLEEKSLQACIDTEIALKARMFKKWSVLKLSKNKNLVKKFQMELVGQKNIIALRQKQMKILVEKYLKIKNNTINNDKCKKSIANYKPLVINERLVNDNSENISHNNSKKLTPPVQLNTNLEEKSQYIIPDLGSNTTDNLQLMYEQEIMMVNDHE